MAHSDYQSRLLYHLAVTQQSQGALLQSMAGTLRQLAEKHQSETDPVLAHVIAESAKHTAALKAALDGQPGEDSGS